MGSNKSLFSRKQIQKHKPAQGCNFAKHLKK